MARRSPRKISTITGLYPAANPTSVKIAFENAQGITIKNDPKNNTQMGTNYYATPIPTEREIIEMKGLIDLARWDELREVVPSKVHVGKSSGGWEFCFNHNNGTHYGKSRRSIEEFLEGCAIENEYGDAITPESFWGMVDSKMGGQIYHDWERVGLLRFCPVTDFS